MANNALTPPGSDHYSALVVGKSYEKLADKKIDVDRTSLEI